MKTSGVRLAVWLSLLALFFAACGGSDPADEGAAPGSPLIRLSLPEAGLQVDAWSQPQPPREGLAQIELQVRRLGEGADEEGGGAGEGGAEAVSGLSIRVIPWMGEHGHGSNEVVAQETEPGSYLASDVLFNMPGNWELKLVISGAAEGEATSASFAVLP